MNSYSRHAVDETSSKKDEIVAYFGKYFFYPKPLLVSYNSGVPEFEPCTLKHRRRKLDGSTHILADILLSCGSCYVGSLDDSHRSDQEDFVSSSLSTFES